MAFYKVLCGVTLMLLLTPDGFQAREQECGKLPEGRHEYIPWEVVISFDGGQCLGSLINHEWVVTDGHCGDKISYSATIHLGCTNMSFPRFTCKESRSVSDSVCTKPTYNSMITRDSICLVQLDTPVNFTDLISPVCVAGADSFMRSGTETWVVSCSSPDPLLEIPLVGHNECTCFLPQVKVRDHMICAGHRDHHWLDDNCSVNIGGGLLVDYNGYWTLIGVVRLDPTCSELDALKTYSSVVPFSEYISTVTQGHQTTFISIHSIGTDPDIDFVCPHPPGPPMPPTAPPTCPDPPAPQCPEPEGGRRVDSVFDSGVMPTSPFVLLYVLVLSLWGVYW